MGALAVEAMSVLGAVLRGDDGSEELEWMAGVPGLAGRLPEGADERAAEHERVLGRSVFAFESVFLSSDGLRGGARTAAVARWFERSGFEVPADPDGLGEEILLYAALCSRDDPSSEVFFREHLGVWAAPALLAIERQDAPFYTQVAAMLAQLLADRGPPGPGALPEVADPLADRRTGLADLAQALVTPVHAGWFLSRRDVQRLAGLASLPVGFGSRKLMLTNLFRAAVEYDRLSAVLAVLEEEGQWWRDAYRRLGASSWLERLGDQQALLRKVRGAAEEAVVGSRTG